jgi:hypothetical protein
MKSIRSVKKKKKKPMKNTVRMKLPSSIDTVPGLGDAHSAVEELVEEEELL